MIKARERFAYLRMQLDAFKNDYVNRQVRIGATLISFEESGDEGWKERTKQYETELAAFGDHIKSIRNLMAIAYEEMTVWERFIENILGFFYEVRKSLRQPS